jgi:hypothetical protein
VPVDGRRELPPGARLRAELAARAEKILDELYEALLLRPKGEEAQIDSVQFCTMCTRWPNHRRCRDGA